MLAAETDISIVAFTHTLLRLKSSRLHALALMSQEFARRMAKHLGKGDGYAMQIGMAVGLADIGQIVVADSSLTGVIHAELGAVLLQQIKCPLFDLAAQAAMHHHECYDGSGYPHGLSGQDIPFVARIAAAATLFSVGLHSQRRARSHYVAVRLAELRALSGICLDPEIVEALELVIRDDPDCNFAIP